MSTSVLLHGRFVLGPELGRGASSRVFAVHDVLTGRELALKRRAWPTSPDQLAEARERLRREARLMARLGHADVLEVVAHGESADEGWIAMERLDADLGAVAASPIAIRAAVLARVARVLASAHRQGIVHRDLKPSNIRVDWGRQRVAVADFGVAHDLMASASGAGAAALTATGALVGTPAYMAPEQLAGAPLQTAADAWALGVVAYEALAGRRPHEAPTLGALLAAVARAPIVPLASAAPTVPPGVSEAVMALLERDPALRPADLDAWADRLLHAAASPSRGPGPGP